MRYVSGALLLPTLVAGCTTAASLHRAGLTAVTRGEYETGVAELSQAVTLAPGNVAYRLDYQTRREYAVDTLIAQADAAQRSGQLDGAGALYRRILAVDPQNSRAREGLEAIERGRRHDATLQAARQDFEHKDFDAAEVKVQGILSEDAAFAPARELAAAIKAARGPVTVTPRLQARGNHRVTLQLRDAPTKMVFEVLQRETGINFILDKDVKGDAKTTIFVQDVPVEQAIDLVIDQNALARTILADNTVLIYPNIASKQKDYEQQVVRTFYLTNAAPKDVENLFKTVLGTKTLYVDERANLIVMRDSPDVVRMAEKLVASIDIAEPEVMLEVEVLEISRSRVQDLGVQYPTSVSLTANSVGTAASSAAAGAGGLVLYDLAHQNTSTVGVSGVSVTLNAMKQAGLVDTLASPRIRVRNKEKAKILIGSKEPVITNSVTPVASGVPVVTGSVQYLDVGLTLDVQPTVYLDSDVAIKLALEMSSILKQVTTQSGTIAYEIGTRNANTMLRLRDGETQVLGGLIQMTDTHTANTIPGLGDIPLLSHLFGTHHADLEKDELVLSITPHIIRMQRQPASDDAEFWYGTETRAGTGPYNATPGSAGSAGQPASGATAPSAPAAPPALPDTAGTPTTGEPAAGRPGAAATGTDPAAPPGPGSTLASATAPAGATAVVAPAALKAAAPAERPPITAPPATVAANIAPLAAADGAAGTSVAVAAGTVTTPAAAAAGVAAASSGASALTLDGPAQAKVGDEFQVHVRLATDQSITRLRSQLRFDSSALQLMSAEAGDLVPAAAGNPKVETRGGGAQLDLTTTSDSPVQGQGSLMVLQFKALAAHPTTIMAMVNVLGSAGAAVGNSTAAPLRIAIEAAAKP